MVWYWYAKIYYLYRTALFRAIRLLLFFFLFTWVFAQISDRDAVRIPLFVLYLFILWESFFKFRIAKYAPTVSIDKNDGSNLYSSCTMPVLYALLTENTTQAVLTKLLSKTNTRTILYKIGTSEEEVHIQDVPLDKLVGYAGELVKNVQGQFITGMDVLVAYLLLTETQSKLLFSKKLKPEELMHILQWARFDFSDEELPKKFRVHFDGGGIGETLVTGWTLETKKYTNDFTYTALRKRPLLMGRVGEYHQMLEGISKPENNNVLVVGDIGVGKENLIRALAYDSFTGKLGGSLDNKHFFELMIGQLIAGAANRSDLETRLQAIIEEVSHARNVILYIPEFQNVLGTASYGINLSGALLPYLKEGHIPVIATISMGNYKTYMEENPIKDAFTVVKLTEPTEDIALQMLMEKATEIETDNRVILTYKAIATAAEYADRYDQESILPGSGVKLLQDTAHAVAVSGGTKLGKTNMRVVFAEDVLKKIEEKTHIAVSEPQKEEKELLLHLEDKLHERVVDQVEAVTVIAEAMRRLRSGFVSAKKPISFLFLGPTGVGKTETAKALAHIYFGGENKMIRLDMSEYTDQDGVRRLLGAPPGQGEERGELTDKIRDNPFSLILLDEFEKANPKILDLFLQVLEDGRLTDNKGKTVSFVNTIIIATSNAASEYIRQEIGRGVTVNKQFQQGLLDFLQSQGIFKPELLNRFDDVVTFKPLGISEIEQITKMLLTKVAATLKEQDITVIFDQNVIAKIAKEGFDQQFGARPIRRYIQDNIEDLLAQKKLRDEIKRGNSVTVGTDQMGNIVTYVV